MEIGKGITALLLCALFGINILSLDAKIVDFDEYWQKRAKASVQAAEQAYEPDPEALTDRFNKQVQQSLGGSNSTRRKLGKNKGPCKATNPIDRCWRCDKNWARDRKKLADCVMGFGRMTTGGKAGAYYVVTDPSDNDLVNPKPGTLRYAVIQDRPLWIIFARSMLIKLNAELMINSDKTIDARGANVHVCFGAQITIQFVRNVIIHGLHIHDIKKASGGLIRDSEKHFGFRSESDGDGVSIYGSNNVWLDHLSMSNCYDGIIDAIEGSTAITISNCHFTKQNDVMLFGASGTSTKDSIMQITLAFNHFGKGLIQRMPRVRFGFTHVVNNDYTYWEMYAIGGSNGPTILSQGNRYLAPPNIRCKEVTKRTAFESESEWKLWRWVSEGDLLLNGAFFVESGIQKIKKAKQDMIRAKPGTYAGRLTRFSGALNCVTHKPC
ncbi:pectate lyase-like [Euphorbia lathyris]|uniref:pectate lyase-like n=1 Tax=Euphorbia lathyris TaxID=212925 RepID=UPI003313A388